MTGAWDADGPPVDLLRDCVHCGFCLPTCPSYVVFAEEMDSPRGRIVLMGAGHEEGERVSRAMVEHFDRCLGCMACVTACPSGVRYDELIERTRPQLERHGPRRRRERALRRAVFALAPHPGRLRALAPLAPLGRLLPGPLGRMARAIRPRAALHRLPTVTPARGPRRGTVALLQGCVQRAFFGDVNAATVRVLAAEGWEVHAPAAPRCCGALQHHAGDAEGAAALAADTERALGGYDRVVVNVAGCGSALKERGTLPAVDVLELLADGPLRTPLHRLELRVAYHDACHLAHAQGIREQPRALLRAIPGVELVEPAEWELCCGSAGIYNLVQPAAADELGRRKAANLAATGAEVVAAANPGCVLQIGAYLDLPVVHPVVLLDRAMTGGGARGD